MNLNKCFIIGRITSDLELRKTANGKSVLNFSIATNKDFKDKNGIKQKSVQYHNCVAWEKPADIINQYSGKGKLIFIEGMLQTRTWEHNGSQGKVTEILVLSVQLGPKEI
jgi:single-strand DNA-binding protein